jgi:Cu/Ag efflux pump CusA
VKERIVQISKTLSKGVVAEAILIVYLPILALVGTKGKIFVLMGQTVDFSILGAFILFLTYVDECFVFKESLNSFILKNRA